MALVQFAETPDSRTSSANPPQVTLRYKAVGEPSDAIVGSYALSATPLTVITPVGQLWRQDIHLDPDGWAQYKVAVSYGQKKKNTGDWTFNFDTTGATTKVKVAREHLGTYYPSGSPLADTNPHHGAIGVKPDGDCDGADIVIPALKLGITFRFATGQVSIAQVKTWARNTGRTNSDSWIGFDAGELLFLGCTGSDGSQAETEVTFQVAASQNVASLTFGDIVGIVKKGHAYAWVEFEDSISSDNKAGTTKPKACHVERVYDSMSFNSVLFSDGNPFP